MTGLGLVVAAAVLVAVGLASTRGVHALLAAFVSSAGSVLLVSLGARRTGRSL